MSRRRRPAGTGGGPGANGRIDASLSRPSWKKVYGARLDGPVLAWQGDARTGGAPGGSRPPPEPPAQIMGETATLTGAVSTDAPPDARGRTAGEGPGDPPGVGDVTLRKLSSSGADGGCRGLAAAQGLRYFGKC